MRIPLMDIHILIKDYWKVFFQKDDSLNEISGSQRAGINGIVQKGILIYL